jgi:hypothetical protein
MGNSRVLHIEVWWLGQVAQSLGNIVQIKNRFARLTTGPENGLTK